MKNPKLVRAAFDGMLHVHTTTRSHSTPQITPSPFPSHPLRDEDNLEENERIKQELNPRKIDEPKTPFWSPQNTEDEADPSSSSGGGVGASALNANIIVEPTMQLGQPALFARTHRSPWSDSSNGGSPSPRHHHTTTAPTTTHAPNATNTTAMHHSNHVNGGGSGGTRSASRSPRFSAEYYQEGESDDEDDNDDDALDSSGGGGDLGFLHDGDGDIEARLKRREARRKFKEARKAHYEMKEVLVRARELLQHDAEDEDDVEEAMDAVETGQR